MTSLVFAICALAFAIDVAGRRIARAYWPELREDIEFMVGEGLWAFTALAFVILAIAFL